MISLALETAMRRGELLTVKAKDINFNLRTLHIPKTKTGYPRTIPLSQKALESLSIITSDSDMLFRVTPNAFRLA
jgi:integrase